TVRLRTVHRADQRPVGPRGSLDGLARLAGDARERAEREGLTLAGAAVAVPGLVAAGGLVRLAPNLGWRDVDVLGALRRHPALADLSVSVDNEANLAALGELHAGPGGPVNFLYISGEIGVGAGIVLGGSLYRGGRGWSGELGHLPVRPEGPVCRCGARGCLEQYAGQEAILRAAGLPDGPAGPEPALARLAELAAAGDTDTLRALAGAADALGVAVSGVINLLDLDTIVLGGGYPPLARWLRPGVLAEIERRVLTAAWSPVEVRSSAWGADAAVIGAAGAVVRSVRDDPARWLATRRIGPPGGPAGPGGQPARPGDDDGPVAAATGPHAVTP
ncbi:MAG TPA: ROK family protein, partial [Catenuloplanes sp.]